MTPEFPRPVRLDMLGDAPYALSVEADEGERVALCARFGLVRIDRLSAEAALTRDGDIVLAEGSLTSELVQACVATGADVPQSVSERFSLRFVPEISANEGEIELGEEDLDVIAYAGGAVDLGEAVAQTLALAIDPFPRAPDADAALRAAGVVTEAEAQASPFAKLLDIRDRLAK